MADVITFLAAAGAEAHAEPSTLGLTITAWVSLAMLVLVAIVLWRRVPAAIGASLDKRIGEIRSELDAAKELRAEAERLRGEYEARLAAAAADAEAMKARAQAEAETLLANAEADTQALIARRQQMATDKIAAAERTAIAEIRAKVARAASEAAATLIAENHDASADQALVDATVAQLGNRLN